MIEILSTGSGDALLEAGRLLHDFNTEYDEPAPPPAALAERLTELLDGAQTEVLLVRDQVQEAVGIAVLRLQPSLWSTALEAYLAELYVVPDRRGQGFGRELITETLRLARERGADYVFLVTSEDDKAAQRLYDAAGFRRTEGEGGPLMIAFEREL